MGKDFAVNTFSLIKKKIDTKQFLDIFNEITGIFTAIYFFDIKQCLPIYLAKKKGEGLCCKPAPICTCVLYERATWTPDRD